MFKDLLVKDFMAELASDSPAPGGGSVAALAGAIGSSLSAMVFSLTVGKKAFNEQSEEIKELIVAQLKEAQEAKEEFLDLIDKDTDAFMTLMASFKLPKESDEEKAARSVRIQEGYKLALEVPLEMAIKAYKMYNPIMTACTYGNKNAISDAGVAALMIQSSIEGAILNVRINLSSIKDEEYKVSIKAQCEELVSNGAQRQKEILAIVNKEIG